MTGQHSPSSHSPLQTSYSLHPSHKRKRSLQHPSTSLLRQLRTSHILRSPPLLLLGTRAATRLASHAIFPRRMPRPTRSTRIRQTSEHSRRLQSLTLTLIRIRIRIRISLWLCSRFRTRSPNERMTCQPFQSRRPLLLLLSLRLALPPPTLPPLRSLYVVVVVVIKSVPAGRTRRWALWPRRLPIARAAKNTRATTTAVVVAEDGDQVARLAQHIRPRIRVKALSNPLRHTLPHKSITTNSRLRSTTEATSTVITTASRTTRETTVPSHAAARVAVVVVVVVVVRAAPSLPRLPVSPLPHSARTRIHVLPPKPSTSRRTSSRGLLPVESNRPRNKHRFRTSPPLRKILRQEPERPNRDLEADARITSVTRTS
mmetsp:Transcript_4636/g.14182  ORF Transcript_4636/g.14182 Transcript_4636/m.14182 type:complete len:372 (+) Transcript_4636:1243-2358(+)